MLGLIWRRATYVQAIPIFLPGDSEISRYLTECRAEIDAITGEHVHVLETDETKAGDTSAIVAVIDNPEPRFPGLTIDDLPCLWLEDNTGENAKVHLPADVESTKRALRALASAARKTRNARVIAEEVERAIMTKSNERKLAVLFGVIFVAAILVIAIFIPNPTPFSYTVFRIVLALAAAGFVSMTPGFIEAQVGNAIKAGGAIAVFVIVYFFVPAALPPSDGVSSTSAPASAPPDR